MKNPFYNKHGNIAMSISDPKLRSTGAKDRKQCQGGDTELQPLGLGFSVESPCKNLHHHSRSVTSFYYPSHPEEGFLPRFHIRIADKNKLQSTLALDLNGVVPCIEGP